MSSKSEDTTAFLLSETSISVAFTGIMSAATIFTITLLISLGHRELFTSLLYLFISMFGYLYSTIIYANASGQLARLRRLEGEKILSVGNIISEYFGVYYTVFAFPLAFLALTGKILSISILIVNILGFVFYHVYGFSILERYIRSRRRFYAIVAGIIIVYVLNYFTHMCFSLSGLHLYTIISTIALISYTIILTVFCLQRKER